MPEELNYGPVAEQFNSSGIAVYPTISSGNFYVTGNDGGMEIKIYNLLGEIVYQSIINKHSSINLDSPGGVYFVNVKTEKDSFTQKIIIQK